MAFGHFVAAHAMQGLMVLQHAVADNLANANTAGYRKGIVSFGTFPDAVRRAAEARSGLAAAAPLMPAGLTSQAAALVAPSPMTTNDATPGRLEKTGNPLDLALEGPGWLVVTTANGDRLLRGGTFHIDPSGHLATSQGALLQGTDGQALRVSGQQIQIDADGTVHCDGQAVGQVRRVDLPAEQLVRTGGSMAATPGTPVRESTAAVRQGWLESSNVEPIAEMVQMIGALRSFDFLGHVVRAEDEILQRSATDVGRTR